MMEDSFNTAILDQNGGVEFTFGGIDCFLYTKKAVTLAGTAFFMGGKKYEENGGYLIISAGRMEETGSRWIILSGVDLRGPVTRRSVPC